MFHIQSFDGSYELYACICMHRVYIYTLVARWVYTLVYIYTLHESGRRIQIESDTSFLHRENI